MSSDSVSSKPTLQPRLPDTISVKLVGLGGTGHIVARYGALFLASLQREARLVLIDGDSFEPHNASRMLFSTHGNKAQVTRDELLPRFAETGLALIAMEEYLTPDNISLLIQEGDLVLLTVDNHATRKLLNDYCIQLENICLISGGNDGVGQDGSGTYRQGSYGNVQVYLRREGLEVTPPLTRHHPEIQHPQDQLPTELHCTDLIPSVPQILFANLAVASALLNTLWLLLCDHLHYYELGLNIADGLMRPIAPVYPLNLEAKSKLQYFQLWEHK